jgi:hypothetical protein
VLKKYLAFFTKTNLLFTIKKSAVQLKCSIAGCTVFAGTTSSITISTTTTANTAAIVFPSLFSFSSIAYSKSSKVCSILETNHRPLRVFGFLILGCSEQVGRLR